MRRLLLAAALFTTACTGEGTPARGPGGAPGGGRGAPPPPAVAVAPAILEPVEERLLGHAALEAESTVEVTVRAEGRVIEVRAEAGDTVAQGDVLAVLDPTRPSLALREAELALVQAKSALARTEQIYSQGVGSAEELEQARTALKQSELRLEQAQLDLAETALRSPLAGVVTQRQVDLGQTLRPGDVGFQVADRTPLLARVRIPEAQAERVRVGQEARVRIEGRPEAFLGQVTRIAPLVDLESGTVVVTVALEAGTHELRLNRFATVELVVAKRAQALTIPLDALAVRGRDDRVLVCVPQASDPRATPAPSATPGGGGRRGGAGQVGKVELRTIRTGVRQGGRIEVAEGLAPGELVVIAAPDDLRSGAEVRVVTAPSGEPGGEAGVAAPTSARRVGSPTRSR